MSHAILRVINTRSDDLQLVKELEYEMAELQQFDELVEKEMKQTLLTIASLQLPTQQQQHNNNSHHNNAPHQQKRNKVSQRIQKESFRFDPTMRIAGEAAVRKLPHHRHHFIQGDRKINPHIGLGLDDVRLQAILWDPTANASDTSRSLSSSDDDDDNHSVNSHSQSHHNNHTNTNAEHNALLLTNEDPAVDSNNAFNMQIPSLLSIPPNYPKPSAPFKSPSRKILNKT